jgi:hypothetical protein
LVEQFKKEIISGFWSCYKNNRSGKGWKKFILTCHEAVFVQIFRNYIRYSSVDRWYRCVFKGVEGKESLNECLGSDSWAIKYYENNEVVFSDICTRSEDGGDVTFIWKEIKIVDSRGNETISNKLTVKLCINRSTLDLDENNNL